MATVRQKKAIKNIGKYRTDAETLEKADYSPSYAKSGLIKRTQGWNELMDKYLPDKDLAKVHKEGLQAGKHIFKNNNETGEIEDLGIEPDYSVRHKYLESGYKLKGSYEADEQKSINILMPVLVKFLNEKDDKTEKEENRN